MYGIKWEQNKSEPFGVLGTHDVTLVSISDNQVHETKRSWDDYDRDRDRLTVEELEHTTESMVKPTQAPRSLREMITDTSRVP